jgi:hypothetical protein
MAALEKVAYFQQRRDEIPNQELARELAQTRDQAGIAEITANLVNKNKNIRSDCLKVLYEIGYIDPALISYYVADFLNLLKSKDNRMVWGGMIALGTIADLCPTQIWAKVDDVIASVEHGSVITVVWGIKALARVSSANPTYSQKIFPCLMQELKTCIPRDVPTHAENILIAVNRTNLTEFVSILRSRMQEFSPSQLTRIKKILKQADKIP